MTLALTYDPALSRVRVVASTDVLNDNPSFESGATGWSPNGEAAFGPSTAFAHTGTTSALLTPNGSSGTPSIEPTTMATVPVTAGTSYTASAWVYMPNGGRTVTSSILWLDADDQALTLAIGPEVAVPAATWTQVTVAAAPPAGAVRGGPRVRLPNMPAATDLLYVDDAILRTTTTAASVTVERSVDGIRWSPVRGGDDLAVDGSSASVDDYEFAADVPNTYRARIFDTGGALLHTMTATITPTLGTVWLKSVTRPFLNRPVTLVDFGDITRPARGGVFDVVGRSAPLAVTDVRGSRRVDVVLMAPDAQTAEVVDLFVASGDPVFLHCPATCPVPSMYAAIGGTAQSRRSTRGPRRYFTLPLIEVAAPDPVIVGATVTWQSVVNAYATWSDLAAAEDSWQDLAELIGDPGEVIVP